MLLVSEWHSCLGRWSSGNLSAAFLMCRSVAIKVSDERALYLKENRSELFVAHRLS
jgi:hypothetical protein